MNLAAAVIAPAATDAVRNQPARGTPVSTINVVPTTTCEGKTITTEDLHYDPQSGRLWSDVQTRIRNPDGTEQIAQSMTATIVDGRFTSFNARGASGTTRGVAF